MNIEGANNPTNTNISDDVLRELFCQIDIQIMVADLETDEILYANDKMNAAYNVDYDPTGKRCWETYQMGKDGRCDFCPLHQLKNDPSQSVEWEIFNEATGRWFRNKSSIIRWSNGRLVHLEQGTDITNIRKASEALREAEAYTQMMLDSTPLSCAVWDEDGNLLDANQESLRLFGLQEKPEYIVNFYSLSPNLQPDGEPSPQKAKRMVAKALETGYARFDWDFKMKGGERLPADIMLIRVPYKNGFRVLSYSRDMREANKVIASTKRYTDLLQAASDVAADLMAAASEHFDETLVQQLKALGEAVGASRVSVWENFMQGGGVWHRQIYRWASDEKWLKNVYAMYHEESYDVLPNNAEKLFGFQTINSRICDMAEVERTYFAKLGVKAILMIPIITNSALWGFIAFDNCVDDQLTPDIEVSVLQSTGIMMASAIMRNRANARLIANEHVLKMDSKLLGAVNHVAANLMANNASRFTDMLQGCLEILGKSVRANRVSIWRNFEDENGRLCSRRLSVWGEVQESRQPAGDMTLDFASKIPEWDKSVKARRDINMPLRQMSEAFRKMAEMQNGKSVVLVQIEMGGKFWGFVAYVYDREERLLEQAETDILRSGGTMIASAIIQNEVNQKLLVATDEALASVRAKNEFMARMSHEIRTPMNAIIGMTSIAQKSEDVGKIKDALDIVATSSQQLLAIINDVLDMATIDIDDLGISNKPYHLRKMLESSTSFYQRQIEEKNLHLHCDIKNVFDRMVIGDEKRTAQIISNLLSNAVKFTPEGGEIALHIGMKVLEDDAALLTIEVADNGPGIDKDFLPLAFDLFEQGDGGITRQYGGIGLGLPITKNLVSLMGGTISVESEQGKGSSFVVELPIVLGEPCTESWEQPAQEAEPPAAAGDNPPDWHDKCVLLVEDIEINRLIAMEMMADTGVAVECAENGKQAFEMFSSAPDRYDLILMDMQMPVMDGLEATRQIRALNTPDSRAIPIYAMTANAYKEDAEACVEAGMNGHIPKPIDVDILYKAMEEAFSPGV